MDQDGKCGRQSSGWRRISGASREHGDAPLDLIKGGGFFLLGERLLGSEDGRCFMFLR
jgi:hypothetical protein